MLEMKMGPEESACFQSSISSSRAVPAGAVLGPCALTHTSLCDSIAFIACKSSDRRETARVLQMDPSLSSKYLQMIQSARNTEEQNLEAYMKNGHLVFRAINDIPENTELLVWYGRDLAKLLGLSRTEQKNTKGLICSECKQSFLFEFPLLAHKRFFCTKKPTSFLKKITIPEIHSRKPATNFHNLARELENCRKNRLTDAKSPKRRRSLESDTDESDSEASSLDTHGDENVLVKRFCVNAVNRCSWSSSKSFSKGQSSPCSLPQCHDNCRTDPDNQDLKTKSAFTTGVSNNVQGDKNKKSAFTQPPPHNPLMSTSLTNNLFTNRTSVLPGILPLNFHSSALLNTDLPKHLAHLSKDANLWPKTSHLLHPHTNRLQSLLTPSLSSLGLPFQNWCAKCNISFHLTSDLVQHMRSHHKRALSDERESRHRDERLKCPVCNETFRERHHLSRHMTSHS
ncbi:PR domain zinc finger protein 8 [Carassius carassius]|uniref:PR domain zinc finger protein 8 n=1 Tax=Carassius carassius TaxID=217509 RepID=UPI0028691C97|nr:PR domain zinc finger protein 8 [Carassius carassius]